jgi:hypothetical protein
MLLGPGCGGPEGHLSCGHGGQGGEQGAQVGLGVEAMQPAVLHQGVKDGGGLPGTLVADESSHPRGVSPPRCSQNRT